MKKYCLLATILLSSTSLFSEVNFNIGPQITLDNVLEFSGNEDKFTNIGLFWEINSNNFGIGMSCDLKLISQKSFSEERDQDWLIDWSSTADLKYYFLPKKYLISPYLGISLGTKTLNLIEYYDMHDSGWEKDESGKYIMTKTGKDAEGKSLQSISVIALINLGANINIKNNIIGIKLASNVLNNSIYNSDISSVYDNNNIFLTIQFGKSF